MATNNYIPALITMACVGAYLYMRSKRSTDAPSLIDTIEMRNYFGDSEFINSSTAKQYGISNQPTDQAWANLHALRDNILNPAREMLEHPIYITSGYRSPELNKLVGGASNSQHTTGEAVDITTKNLALNRELFAILVQLGNFDQLIWEKGGEWIHVSYRPFGRGQMLSYNGSSYTNINNNWQNII